MTLIPGWSQINRFPTPLEEGERRVVLAYEQLLQGNAAHGPRLDIYVQPFLENYRPDVVVAASDALLIIEVKDWTPETAKDGGKHRAAKEQVTFYRSKLIELVWCDIESTLVQHRMTEAAAAARRYLQSAVRTAVVIPFAPDEMVRGYGGTVRVCGAEMLMRPESLLCPTAPASLGLNPALLSVLRDAWQASYRSWLAPPFHYADQGIVSQSQFTVAQRRHALPRGPGWYRLQGPAGSGKSMVLTHRAASLASQGKQVLVVCFNATLTNYLRDLIKKCRYDFNWERITLRHFHELLKQIRLKLGGGFSPEEREGDRDYLLSIRYPELVSELLDAHPDHPFRFDAVLVDEGQDFGAGWFTVLAKCLKSDGELLLVRDKQQNLYGQNITWSDNGPDLYKAPKGGRGFDGQWANLPTTWRMSPLLTEGVSRFSVEYLRADPFTVDATRGRQSELFDAAFCRWENVNWVDIPRRVVEIVKTVTQRMAPAHPSDIAIVTLTNDDAWRIVQCLQQHHVPSVHLYDSDGQRDGGRIFRFRKGDGRVKVCTGHSFKGFEVWGVVVCAKASRDDSRFHQWVYTAMSRGIEGLWVLNCDPRLDLVEKWFPCV